VHAQDLVASLRNISARHGRQTALITSLQSVTRVVRSLEEVAERCGEDPACRDGPSVLGKVNVTTSVCARIYPGQYKLHADQGDAQGGCEAYASVTRALVDAAPVIMEPQYSVPPERFCATRVKADAGMSACASKLHEYGRMCESATFRTFCRRQQQYLNLHGQVTDASATEGERIFESCSESSVGEYMEKVAEVNTACAAEPSFEPLSDHGGTMLELLPRWQDQCITSSKIGLFYAGLSLLLYIAIFAVIAIAKCFKVELPWMTVADFTTDICRSRRFTAVGVTWLLYAFYTLMLEYFIHPDSGTYMYIQAAKVPKSLYFLALSVGWVPHFMCLLQANNPYRSRAISFTITGTGIVLQHLVAATMIYLKVFRLLREPAGSVLKELAMLEVCISGLLCLALDVCFLQMITATEYVIRFRDSCLAHTREVLNQPPSKPPKDFHKQPRPADAEGGGEEEVTEEVTEEERLKRQVGTRIVVHVGCAKGAVPTHDEMAYHLSHHLLGGAFPPRRLVVTSLKIVKPRDSSITSSEELELRVRYLLAKMQVRYHSDLAVLKAPCKDACSVLTMWPLDGPGWFRWFKKRLQRTLAPGTTVVEVSMLVCGACRTLQERRWLCDILERECAVMGQRKDDAGFVHISGRLANYRKLLHSVDQHLIRLMIDRLNSSLLIQALSTTAEQRARKDAKESPMHLPLTDQTERQGTSMPLTLDQLQMLMGPTFHALKESILTARLAPGLKWESVGVAEPKGEKWEIFNEQLVGALAKGQQEFTNYELDSFQVYDLSYNSYVKVGNVYFRPATRAVADRNTIATFLAICTRSGVLFEHAEILSCLPADELQRVQSEIEQLQKHGQQDRASLHKVHLLVAAEASKEFMQARNLLVEQLQAPAFHEWLRENSSIISNPGWPSKTVACTDAQPGFPLAATFAFFQETVAADIRAGPLELSAEDITSQLIGLGNFHNGPDFLKDEALGRNSAEMEEAQPAVENSSKDTRFVLKAFRALVYKAVTLQNNPSIIADIAMRRRKAVNIADVPGTLGRSNSTLSKAPSFARSQVQSRAQELVVLSVQEWKPRAVAAARLATRFVVMQPPEHEAKIADAKKHSQDQFFLPTILWVSIMLALLMIVRTFAINMMSLSHAVGWLLDLAAWLHSSCDRVELVASTSVGVFK